MKELDKDIKKAGFTYIQEFADTSWFIYSQYLKGEKVGHIVFRRVKNTHYDCISFPNDKAFGRWAWQTWTYERALTHVK